MASKDIMREYISYVKKYMKERLTHDFIQDDLLTIIGGMDSVLLSWTGDTYVGRKKSAEMEMLYQSFFVTIYKFLMFCKENASQLSDLEKDLAEKILYQGIVFRYLGKSDVRNYKRKEIVMPEYNNIYVSWSKTEKNPYIESKLRGPITWLKAEIHKSYYGIDIHGFELWCQEWLGGSSFITRGEEKEVVFPTIEDCMIEVKQI